MLQIEKFVTASPEQWEIIIEGMRNPKNSWDRMDSGTCSKLHWKNGINCDCSDPELCPPTDCDYFIIGENDHLLMDALNDGGPVHAKYRRMIPVWVTLTAPLYWWKEFDTYKVGTVSNSCSTMHKIHAKPFTVSDISCDELMKGNLVNSKDELVAPELKAHYKHMMNVLDSLNNLRDLYLRADEKLKNRELTDAEKKHIIAQRQLFWRCMIEMLPSSYNQKRTVKMNYEVLCNIYRWRKNHKLNEWHTFCDWIRELPYSELIIGDDADGSGT